MLLECERYYDLGMAVLVTVCCWKRSAIIACEWTLWWPHALGKQTLSWLGHCCFGDCMLLEYERSYGLGMDALVTILCSSKKTSVFMFWAWMLCRPYALENEHYQVLDVDSLVTVCSWNTKVLMAWAWMLW